MTSRERILGKLRSTRKPFANLPPPDTYRHIVPLEDSSPAALQTRFVAEMGKLGCKVTQTANESEAIDQILQLLEGDKTVLSWDFACIPLPGLPDALNKAGCKVAAPNDPNVRVGITGVDAALAATGSLVLLSGAGKPRHVSLLPTLHIAVVAANQMMPDFETWMAQQENHQDAAFRQSSNIVVITGPSRTADIAMELILGMHGPKTLHIILIE